MWWRKLYYISNRIINITSTTGETLKINILNKEPSEIYEIDGNFVNPDGLLYEIDT